MHADLERRVMFIILSLIVLIAAMNIISGLVMLVKNKSRDIEYLSIGLTRSSILRIFYLWEFNWSVWNDLRCHHRNAICNLHK